jgi:hypothetical protein
VHAFVEAVPNENTAPFPGNDQTLCMLLNNHNSCTLHEYLADNTDAGHSKGVLNTDTWCGIFELLVFSQVYNLAVVICNVTISMDMEAAFTHLNAGGNRLQVCMVFTGQHYELVGLDMPSGEHRFIFPAHVNFSTIDALRKLLVIYKCKRNDALTAKQSAADEATNRFLATEDTAESSPRKRLRSATAAAAAATGGFNH